MKNLSLAAAGILLSAGLITIAATSGAGTKKDCTVANCEQKCDISTCDPEDCPIVCKPDCK